MKAIPSMWYRKGRGFCVQIGKKQVSLGHDQSEAKRKYGEILAGKQVPLQTVTVRTLFDEFIAWLRTQKKYKPKTIQFYEERCGLFARSFPGKVSLLKAHQIDKWLCSRDWSQATRVTTRSALRRMFNWGVKQKLLSENIIKDTESEPTVRRELVISTEQQTTLENAATPALRDFLIALRETGARPGTIASVTAKEIDFDQGVWLVRDHKMRHLTGKPLLIVMTPALREICERLTRKHPEGPIFRTRNGNAYTKGRIEHAFARLKQKFGFGKECYAYAYRHRFITEALRRGVDSVIVAKLVGHKGTDIIARHYAHPEIAQLQEAAQRATGKG